MRKPLLSFLFITTLAVVFSFPVSALTYSRIPTGSTPTSPITITVNIDDISELYMGSNSNPTIWSVGVFDNDALWQSADNCNSVDDLSGVFTITLPVGTGVNGVDLLSDAESMGGECVAGGENGMGDTDNSILEGGYQPEYIFTITAGVNPLMDNTTGSALNGSIGTATTGAVGAVGTVLPLGVGVMATATILFKGLSWFKGIAGLRK